MYVIVVGQPYGDVAFKRNAFWVYQFSSRSRVNDAMCRTVATRTQFVNYTHLPLREKFTLEARYNEKGNAKEQPY